MSDVVTVSAADLRDWGLPEAGTDKDARGRVFVLGGSRTTPGAVLLATESALRVGAGKVQLATAGSCATAVGVAVPELGVVGLEEDGDGNIPAEQAERILEQAEGSAVALVGSGFTDVATATALLEVIMPRLEGTVVLDALATAYVTQDPERIAELAATVVLTVNPTELARCLEIDEEDVTAHPERHTATLAERTRATVLCGGTLKVVADGDRLWRVETGNPGMAIAGSGDVQAGIVAGLLGRGATPAQAAVWAAYLHGTAGDRLAEQVGPLGYLSRELAGELPGLLAELDSE